MVRTSDKSRINMSSLVDVVYGREVGWTVSKIDLPPEIEAISATKIRNGEIENKL